jgi:hypothetical protein
MTERKIGLAAVAMALSCAVGPIVIGALVALGGIVL